MEAATISRVAIEPGKRGGKPCIRGLRITVWDVLGWLGAGMSEDQIIDEHPDLEKADFPDIYRFAADANFVSIASNFASIASNFASIASNFVSIASNFVSIASNFVSIASNFASRYAFSSRSIHDDISRSGEGQIDDAPRRDRHVRRGSDQVPGCFSAERARRRSILK